MWGGPEDKVASPPAPLRMERGVVCEVTPTGLLMVEDGLLSLRRTYRGNLGDHAPPFGGEEGGGANWGRG